MAMKKFFVGVKGIIRDERGVLLLKRDLKDQNFYDIPGGRIDDTELFEDTLRRELSEELPGTKLVKINKLAGTTRVMRDIAENTGLVLIYFLVEAELPEKIVLSEEHSSYVWVKTVEDIPDAVNEEVKRIIIEIL